jgi:hypothetical protein
MAPLPARRIVATNSVTMRAFAIWAATMYEYAHTVRVTRQS